ncbi:MATE family efflux transporter [Rurimicrobium arvi]|uniref:Multidrug-efflux transporter n=1 Tax=Rurimicrobium arvi TaxID=2049916 RepID=A0ABP8MQY7_9BACT
MEWRKEAGQTMQLAMPIIFGELAQMALHLLDTAMIGRISHVQLAASSLVLNVLGIPFVLGIGMTMSIAQMVSMAQGQHDNKKVSHYFFNGFWLCTFFSVFIALSLFFGRNIILHLNQDPEVARLAIPFLQVMSLSLIPMLLFMALKQFTDGLQHTRTAMVLSVLALPINVGLNWVLIYGNLGFPRMEIMGAAYGTLITRTIIFFALGAVILRHKLYRKYIAVRKSQWYFSRQTFMELLRIGVPSGLQIGMEAGAFAVSGIIIGTIGAVEQAAHQITLSCAAFTFMVSMGLAQAGSIRVSNAYGAGNFRKISLIGKSTLICALIYGVFCALMFVTLRNQLPYLFNRETEVVSMAALLFILAAVFQISDATQAIGAGLLRGLKDVKVPTVLIFIAYWVLGIPSGYALAFVFHLGAPGVWLGFIIGLTFSSIFLCTRFLKLARRHSVNHE